MQGSRNVLRITGLVKEYPRGGGVHGLDLSIDAGTSFGLLGPNGAGKSTTLKLIMGLLRPTSGTISVLDADVTANPETVRRTVGYVPEHQHMYPWMTVAELVWFTRSFYPTWNDDLCASLLEDYALAPDKRVCELSNGMQTKLALVLALSHDPEFLVLDEPTTGLDPLVREEFLDKVHELVRQRRRTILFSSHMMSDVERIADTIGIMNAGKLLIVAPREALLEQTICVRAVLRTQGLPRVAPQGTVHQSFADGCWSLTIHGNMDTAIDSLRANNDIIDLSTRKPDLETILKDYIRGAQAT